MEEVIRKALVKITNCEIINSYHAVTHSTDN